jgi:hypothetical protein
MSKVFTVELHRKPPSQGWCLDDQHLFYHDELRGNLDVPGHIRHLTVVAFTKPSPSRIRGRVSYDGLGQYITLCDITDCYSDNADEDLYVESIEDVLREHNIETGTDLFFEVSY